MIKWFILFVVFMLPSVVSASQKEIMVISPHFDDASLPVGGLLAQSKDSKTVVTVFAEGPEKAKHTLWDTLSGFLSSDTAVKSRKQENANALAILGATPIDLGFTDGQYRKYQISDDDKSKIKDELVATIDQKSKTSSQVDVYFPAYFGTKITHKDHKLIHDIVLDIIASKKFGNVNWYMYEDMPYTISYFKRHGDLLAFLKSHMPNFSVVPKDILLSETDLLLKKQSLDAYPSQRLAFRVLNQPFRSVIDFNRKRCDGKSCERVYEVTNK